MMQAVVFGAILANTVGNLYSNPTELWSWWVLVVESCTLLIFTLEIVLKMIGNGILHGHDPILRQETLSAMVGIQHFHLGHQRSEST